MAAKLVKQIIIFGPIDGSIKVIKKYGSTRQTIDESLMSTLCLPTIEHVDKPKPPRFQTFLVTKEDGQVLYGSGLLVYDKSASRYVSYCYTIITDTPFINATRSLLYLIWAKRCDDLIIRTIMNIPLPAKRRCLRIVPPPFYTPNYQQHSSNLDLRNDQSKQLKNSPSTKQQQQQHKVIDDIYLYRGMPDLPLLDYPLRELFSFLHIDDFLLAFTCILMEFRTLIISQDNYKLMIVGETLTSLLLPLKWCNVYVPILPPVYGATYLDAPTSYIMGINTQVTELPENLNHVQCKIYCDEGRVVCDANSLALPLFLNDLKRDIVDIKQEFEETHQTKPYTYLDDLRFNRAIRVLFIKTIRKNILANYERYIVDVEESSADIRQFDVVSYLSDKPEFMHSFLGKFLDTQLFASFIDENAKRMQQFRTSIFDIDPEELSEHFTDKALENAFQTAHRIHLMDLREEPQDIEVKTVPASPMKLRRRVPGLASLASRLSFATNKTNSGSIDQGNSIGLHSINSSPPIHRASVATVSLQGHISLDPKLHQVPERRPDILPTIANTNTNANRETHSTASHHNASPLAQPVSHGKVLELINEVKDLTKSILIENMGLQDIAAMSQSDTKSSTTKVPNNNNGNNNLIGELCDHIERVWAHGAFLSQQDNSAGCPLWNHLIAFRRLKYIDSKPSKHQYSDGSHLNVLSPNMKSGLSELDMLATQDSNLFSKFNLFRPKKFVRIDEMTRELINDLITIHTLDDVKTDVGKARAFIRLSLEKQKLSDHFRTLLSDQTLLKSLYKPYAFLRSEEEREQFLMYLSTLNTVNLPCFTTTFVSVINTRKMKTSC